MFKASYLAHDVMHCITYFLGHFDANVVFLQIEDLSDLLTVTDAEKLFDYLESRSSQLTIGLEPNRGKGLTLLRFCNELCRRLSKVSF